MEHSGSRRRIRGERDAGGIPSSACPLRPVVCIDETNRQLIKETRIPCEPGQPEKADSVYVRNGVADVFMISEPLAGRRETVVTQTRTALDFAEILQYTSDTLYPRAEKIISRFPLPKHIHFGNGGLLVFSQQNLLYHNILSSKYQ